MELLRAIALDCPEEQGKYFPTPPHPAIVVSHNDTSLTTTGPPSAPTAPLEISTLGPHALTIEWGAPESDGGAPLEGYKIAVRDARRQMWMEVGRVKSDVQKLKVQDLAVSNSQGYMNYALKCV